jgi:NAD-dependent dihydropyrimidine dehydrogenase PreA subunit
MATDSSAMFIRVEVDDSAARDKELAKKLAEVCPVNIFGTDADGASTIIEENLDECVLCELCVEAAPPGRVRVVKLYSGETLKR